MARNSNDSRGNVNPHSVPQTRTQHENDGGTEIAGGSRISLAPLDIRRALSGLLVIPKPEATKPKNKKVPPPKGVTGLGLSAVGFECASFSVN
jgi:hypothetical protein